MKPQLLAGGTLTVEESERLLDALTEGDRKRAGTGRSPGHPRGRMTGRIEAATEGLGGRIAEIVNRAVDSAMKKTEVTVSRKPARQTLEPVDAPEGRFLVEEGTPLVVRNNPRHPGGGSIELHRIEGEECEVESEGPFAVTRDGEKLIVEWDYGSLVLGIPDTVSGINAGTHGGNLSVEDLRIPLDLLTQGGDMNISGVCRSIKARALGGNVWVAVDALDPGTESDVTTNHGDMFASVGPDFTGLVKASSLAGTVQVEEDLGRVFDNSAVLVPRAVTVEIGPRPRAAEITFRTLNGSVFVERGE